jgi:hypothetical protein
MLPLSENELDDLVARERERGSPPLTDWDSLAARLRAEGLITSGTGGSRFASRTWMQAAAAVLLVLGGAAIGRYTANASSKPSPQSPNAASLNAASPNATGQTAAVAAVASANESATLASTNPPEFHSPEEAWATLNRAGEEYQRASAYLSASNTDVPMPTTPDTYRTRLAALDNVMSEMRSALHEAPHDPVINQYYLATVGAREATLRQLGTTLPAGARLNRF